MHSNTITLKNQGEAILWTISLIVLGIVCYVFEYKIDYLPEIYWGFIITLLLFFIQDWFRLPKLKILVGDFNDEKTGSFRIVHVNVINLDWPIWFVIFRRNKAMQTSATIEIRPFSENTLIVSYDGRWSINPEPLKKEKDGFIFDVEKAKAGRYANISPSYDVGDLREGKIAIAIKFKEKMECYGFSDYSYAENFMPEKWRIERGVYKVKVIVKVDRQTFIKYFKLTNDGTALNNLTLEQC